jgi:hypothetical protein
MRCQNAVVTLTLTFEGFVVLLRKNTQPLFVVISSGGSTFHIEIVHLKPLKGKKDCQFQLLGINLQDKICARFGFDKGIKRVTQYAGEVFSI